MNRLLIVAALLLPVFGMQSGVPKPDDKPRQAVVVELFTSEGCSSCPAAERVQHELQQQYDAKQLPVYFVAMHVDYWNRLGWKDVYSQPAFSQRQYDYSHSMGLSGAYTPQSVINGRFETVGSEKEKLEAIIDAELNSPAPARLECQMQPSKDTTAFQLSYKVATTCRNPVLTVLLLENTISSAIKKGETSGLVLQHHNVVRQMEIQVLSKTSGGFVFKPGQQIKKGEYSLLLYLQEPGTMHVLAVAQPFSL